MNILRSMGWGMLCDMEGIEGCREEGRGEVGHGEAGGCFVLI